MDIIISTMNDSTLPKNFSLSCVYVQSAQDSLICECLLYNTTSFLLYPYCIV